MGLQEWLAARGRARPPAGAGLPNARVIERADDTVREAWLPLSRSELAKPITRTTGTS